MIFYKLAIINMDVQVATCHYYLHVITTKYSADWIRNL